MENTYKLLERAVEYLQAKGFGRPKLALILGSGLGTLANELEDSVVAPYDEIPGFASSTVAGHAGRLVYGSLDGVPVVAMQGRFHLYEGHSQRQIVFPVWTFAALGAETLVVTNAAGGLNPQFAIGDLMLITDHINYTGHNPLVGPNPDRFGPRFPDMSRAYTPELQDICRETAIQLNITLQQGVYLAVSGPSYETPGEIKSFRCLGADAVGMSTVPEVIAATHAGLEVLGISCITNMAAGLGAARLDHSEVIEVTKRVQSSFKTLVTGLVARLGRESK